MQKSRSSKAPSTNGTQTGPRHLVAASSIFKRARRDPDAEPPPDAEIYINAPAPKSRPAPPVANNEDLARKLAWAVGSSVGIPYGRKSALHQYFEEHVDQLLADMGLDGP
jgi:hypothetical protein